MEKVICVRFSLGGRKERRQKGLYYRVVAECLFSPTFLVNSINDLAAVICNCCVYFQQAAFVRNELYNVQRISSALHRSASSQTLPS